MFNALKYIKGLEAAGVAREQAEAHVQLVIAAIEDGVATKADILELKGEFLKVGGEFDKVRAEISASKSDVIFKLGTIMVTCCTLGFTAMGILIAVVALK